MNFSSGTEKLPSLRTFSSNICAEHIQQFYTCKREISEVKVHICVQHKTNSTNKTSAVLLCVYV